MTYATIALLLLVSPLLAQDVLDLDTVIPQAQQQAMGLDKASADQRQAFAQWVTQWTGQVINQAPSYHPSQSIPDWVASWPAYKAPVPKLSPEQIQKQTAIANQVIAQNVSNGATIELQDGSAWAISIFDQPKTRRWQRGETIRVENSLDPTQPYRLRNVQRNEFAFASQTTPPSPTGQREEPSPEAYANAIGVQTVRNAGALVILQDGTSWSVADADQNRAKLWKPNDRIVVEHNDPNPYNYTLRNLDSGETVTARPKQAFGF